MQINYQSNPQTAQAGNSFPTIPEGEYRAQLVNCGMEIVKSTGIEKLQWTWEIMDGQYRGCQIREWFDRDQIEHLRDDSDDRPILRRRIDSIVLAHNLNFTGDTDQLLFKPMLVEAKRNGDFTNVRKLRKVPAEKLDFHNTPNWG